MSKKAMTMAEKRQKADKLKEIFYEAKKASNDPNISEQDKRELRLLNSF